MRPSSLDQILQQSLGNLRIAAAEEPMQLVQRGGAGCPAGGLPGWGPRPAVRGAGRLPATARPQGGGLLVLPGFLVTGRLGVFA